MSTFPPGSCRPPGNRTCIPFRLRSHIFSQARRIMARKNQTRSHYLFWTSSQHDLSLVRPPVAVCFWNPDSATVVWSQELAMMFQAFHMFSDSCLMLIWGLWPLVLLREYSGRLQKLGRKFGKQQAAHHTLPLPLRSCRLGKRVVFCRQSATWSV